MAQTVNPSSNGIAAVNLSQLVYIELKSQILNGQLLPGVHLNIRALAADYQTSLVPVREALRQLAGERYVELLPNRGARVSPLSVDEAMQIYLIREALESTAVKLAWGRLTPESERQIQRVIDEMDECLEENAMDRLVDLNTHFHKLIYALSDRPLLCQEIDRYWEMSSRYRHVFSYVPERGPLAQTEHRQILQALKDPHDPEEVARKVREHIQRSADALKQYCMDNLDRESKGD